MASKEKARARKRKTTKPSGMTIRLPAWVRKKLPAKCKSIADLRRFSEETYNALDSGKIDVATANARGAQVRLILREISKKLRSMR